MVTWQSSNAREIGALQHRNRVCKVWKSDEELSVGTVPVSLEFLYFHHFVQLCCFISSFVSHSFAHLFISLRPDPDLEELQRLVWVMQRCAKSPL